MKQEVKFKLDKVNKLAKHEYDPNCDYCVKNPFVVDAQKTKSELEGDKKTAQDFMDDLSLYQDKLEKFGDMELEMQTYNDLNLDINNLKNTHISLYQNQLKVNQSSNLFILPPVDSHNYFGKVGIGLSTNLTEKLNISGGLRVDGNITASGNISASNLNLTSITASGDILLDEDQRIYFEADKQTWIESNGANLIRTVANNQQMLLLDHETGNRAVFGNGTKVFIGANNNELPSNELEVVGTISGSGILSIEGNITGSGNINTTGGRVFEQGTSVIDHATAMAIVFGG